MRLTFLAPEAQAPCSGVVVLGAAQATAFADTCRTLGFQGEEGEVLTLLAPPRPLSRVLVVGLGAATPDAPALRRIGGAIAVALQPLAGGVVRGDLGLGGEAAAELAYGLLLRSYRPLRKYRTVTDPDDPYATPGPQVIEIVTAHPGQAERAFARHDAVARGVFLARDLSNEPTNILGPDAFAERAGLLRTAGVRVEELDPDKVPLPLLATVGRASAQKPRLVVLHWDGAQDRSQRPLVLVGKGLTFDTGGIDIKPAAGMEEMKGDMAGAAAVMGTVLAAALRQAASPVVGILAIAENMIGGNAMRPGDVVTSHSGQTVEIMDTDAEGRLVLADALSWACATFKPRAVVDVATLTGSVVRLLGHHHAGLVSNDDRLAARLTELAATTDEPLWRLPLVAGCDEYLRSPLADLRSCTWETVPDVDIAARFLWHFVGKGVAWAHLDIAGTSDCAEDRPLCPKGTTGFGVRLLDALVGD